MTLLIHSRARSADRNGSFGTTSRSSSNDSYSRKLTNTANNFVNRIRRLSPASWRRRTTEQNESIDSLELGCKPLRSQSHMDLQNPSMPGKFTNLLDNSVDSITFENLSPEAINSFADSILTTSSEPCDVNACQMINTISVYQDFCELHYPDQSVWELKEKFPNTFISLTTAYMRSVELSTKELTELQNMMKEQNQMDSNPLLLQGRSHNTNAVKQKNIKKGWYFVVNHLIRYLIIDEKYKHKFILRRPGNQIHINNLEERLTKYINSPTIRVTSNDLETLLKSYDVAVIGCVLSRLLRKHGPLFGEPLCSIFRQITSENPTRGLEDLLREQRKSLRMIFLLKSRQFRDMILRPLLELLTKISLHDYCQVDESSLAVLFAPIFFIDSQSSQKNSVSIADRTLPKAVEKVIQICKNEFLKNGSIASLFKLSKLFLYDCIKNLHANSIAKSVDDLQPLHCSIRYCVPMTPSPHKTTPSNKSNTSRLQRSHAFLSNRTAATTPNDSCRKHQSNLLDIIGLEVIPSRETDFLTTKDKENMNLNATPRRKLRLRCDEINKEKLKRPRTMISGQLDVNRNSVSLPVKDNSLNGECTRPIIKNPLIEPQLNFRVRKKVVPQSLKNPTQVNSYLNTPPSIVSSETVRSNTTFSCNITGPNNCYDYTNFKFRSPILGNNFKCSS